MSRNADGLSPQAIERRAERHQQMMAQLGASAEEWHDWRWQYRNVLKEPDLLARLISIPPPMIEAIQNARQAKIPFGITPHYLSLSRTSRNQKVGFDQKLCKQLPVVVSQMSSKNLYAKCIQFHR
ncbi:MAG: hypothetical protein M0036_27015 [Desulfobacteraceae bacterium]|nr:hypothetical protein [Desulfobacteraceae bacterium]